MSGTRKVMSDSLFLHSKGRSQAIREAVSRTSRVIEKEIEANGGLYPLNGGRLSQAEFCRRANISQVTLLGKAHKFSTKQKLDKWLQQVTKNLFTGKLIVRKAVNDRAVSWEKQYRDVADKFNIFKIEVITKDEEIDLQRKKICELESEIRRLRQQLMGKVVTPFKR